MSKVAPLFDYADIVWGDKNNDKAAKVILDRPKYSSDTETLTLLDLKPLFICRRSHHIIATYRYVNSETNFNFRQNNIYLSKIRTD